MSVCLSVRPSVRPHGTTRLPLDGFLWNFIFECFSKICRENAICIHFWSNYWLLYMKTGAHPLLSRWILLRMRNVSNKQCRENWKTLLFSITFFPKIVPFSDNLKKYGRVSQTIDGDIIRRTTRFACWITTATYTYSEYAMLLLFHYNSGYVNAPQCHVIRTLPALLM